MNVESQETLAAKLALGLIFSSVANKQQNQNHSDERTSPAAIKIGSKEWVVAAARASDSRPISSKSPT
jgi:hypothetical protein